MTEIRGNVPGGGKKKMNRAENGDVKGTFDGYGDLDGVQCGRGTQCMYRSLSVATPWRRQWSYHSRRRVEMISLRNERELCIHVYS